MPPAPRYAPFVYVFAPFALALAAGNLAAEASPDVTFDRARYTVLVSAAFALPAVVLFFGRDQDAAPPLAFRYWQLFWAFGFLGYALHFYYSVGAWFGWDFAQIWRRQGAVVATTNYVLLAAWGADAALGLRGRGAGGRAGLVLRWAAHLLFVVAFVTASVVFRSDVRTTASLALGVALLAAAAGALAVRFWPGGPAGGPAAAVGGPATPTVGGLRDA